MLRYPIAAAAVLSTAMLAVPEAASAYTECSVRLARVFVGDGAVWMEYTNGGSGYVSSGDIDREATLSVAETALVSQRDIIIRYAADSVACTSAQRGDVSGVWLL